jgi:hypothetical protein
MQSGIVKPAFKRRKPNMKSLHKFLVAALTGAILSLAATAALADGHEHRGHYDERRWEHRHYRHGPPPVYYRGGPAVYAPYYAPAPIYYAPPPPVVYQPHYYAPRPAPAVTIGISPIVIPLN